MTDALRLQSSRTSVPRRFPGWARAWMPVALSIGAATASVPMSNQLGVHFKVLKSGPTATVEIRMTPRRDFDSVTVEAASGVASLAPACGFTNMTVVAGGSYVCQVDITGKPSDAAMTLNVVARRALPGGKVPEMEIHRVTVKNSTFAPAQKKAGASHHVIAEPTSANK